MSIESIIRPFTTEDVTPQKYQQPGAVGAPPVRVVVGLKGGTKTFSFSGSSSASTRIGHRHTERAPTSTALQTTLSTASG